MKETEIIAAIAVSTLFIVFLIAGIVTVIAVAGKRRAVYNHELTQTRLAYEKELRTTQQEIQKQILNQVSSELHDNIGQLLTLMRLQLETARIKQPVIGPVFDPVNQTLSDTIVQVRAVSHSLSSDLLERRGLLETIQHEVKRLQQVGQFTLHFDHDGVEPALENDQKLMVFRIFQELVNNTLKHAAAKEVRISLKGGGGLILELADDGRGYDVAQMLESASGAGLKNIIRRAELAGLKCILNSSPQQGSSCLIRNI